jgi:tungstate transport system ATP-binding protein
MERPDQAQVSVDGETCRWRQAKRRLLADCIYLHQQPYLFEGSVRYNLNYPLKGSRANRDARVRAGLEWSGLEELAEQSVRQLSGGERQRVALARAWLRRPRIMLLDEPSANMDSVCRQRTIELLRALRHEGLALLVTTHDPLHFASLADRTLHLSEGRMHDGDDPNARDPGNKITPIGRRLGVVA